MKSRYSAFALGLSHYIIQTTHKQNCDYKEDLSLWEKEINGFSKNTQFLGVDILDFTQEQEGASVTFYANLLSQAKDISFIEKSKFYKVDGVWLYHSGEFL